MTAVDLLARFARFAEKFPVSIPDRARIGINDLTAADIRTAAAQWRPDMSETQAIAALRPIAVNIPETVRTWSFGTSGLTYGDFQTAQDLTR